MYIIKIQETKEIYQYLEKRGLTKQYKKAKNNILEGRPHQTKLKILHPKHLQKGSFRINQQFRALCVRVGTTLRVYEIDNHQNY